jgi:hypothetical protein
LQIKEELAKLFSQSKTGSTVQPNIEALKQLQELGYIGGEETAPKEHPKNP